MEAVAAVVEAAQTVKGVEVACNMALVACLEDGADAGGVRTLLIGEAPTWAVAFREQVAAAV